MKEKKYKKNWGKVFQIRVSRDEYQEIIKWFSEFGQTHRETITSLVREFNDKNIIVGGSLLSKKEYAWSYGDYKKNNPNICSLCKRAGNGNDIRIVGHHHKGYDMENINNVVWLCLQCHGKVHGGKISLDELN